MRDRPLMVMRVSRTSGRTWEPAHVVRASDKLLPLNSSTWPPCECPRCAAKERQQTRKRP